jgi:hypothetical protein
MLIVGKDKVQRRFESGVMARPKKRFVLVLSASRRANSG